MNWKPEDFEDIMEVHKSADGEVIQKEDWLNIPADLFITRINAGGGELNGSFDTWTQYVSGFNERIRIALEKRRRNF